MFDDCLIMACGSGSRLWPASSSKLSKQFLPAESGAYSGRKKGDASCTFFSMALERSFAVTGSDGRVIVIAGNTHIEHIIADAAKLSASEKKRLIVIVEPAAKNTAPAIACAAKYSLLTNQNEKSNHTRKMIVMTSDHIIKPLDAFKSDAELAALSAAEENIVVFGIPPSRPETGFGYIETESKEQRTKNKEQRIENSNRRFGELEPKVRRSFKVVWFHEKPDLATAKKYAANERYFWNSGMFAFNTDFISRMFSEFAEDVYAPFEKLKAPKKEEFTVLRGVKILNDWHGLKNAYNKAKSISFDFAIVEKCKDSVMVKTSFEWNDIGSWEEYANLCGKNNSLVFNYASENCYVDSDMPVALAGVDDLIVVIRSGKNGGSAKALITKKGQSQKVRDVVEQIKKSGKTELL